MANELRVRANGIGGKCEDNPLTAAATTLTSAGLAAVPVIGTTQHLAVVLDPDGIDGAPEIAWITAHTAAATTATILRAQEGTTARQHLRDTDWIHGATAGDFLNRTYTAYGTAVTTSGTTELTIVTLTIPAQTIPYEVLPHGFQWLSESASGDVFDLMVYISGGLAGAKRFTTRGVVETHMISGINGFSDLAGSALTIDLRVVRISGTGTVSTILDGGRNHIIARVQPRVSTGA